MKRLDNRVAVVTGAAMGNGLGIAKVFARDGARVAMLDYSDQVFESAKTIQRAGGTAIPYRVDVRDIAAVREAVTDAAARFGRIDILVNNAGVNQLMPFLEMPDEVRDWVLSINLLGAWNCAKVVLPYMVEQGYGRVINMSSVTGPIVVDPGQTAYAITKAGLWGFTKALAVEFVEANITVNMICPGYIRTPHIEEVSARSNPDDPEAMIHAIAQTVPMRRLGEPDEIGELAAFLASDAAAYITGQPFVIDGGSTLPETHGARGKRDTKAQA